VKTKKVLLYCYHYLLLLSWLNDCWLNIVMFILPDYLSVAFTLLYSLNLFYFTFILMYFCLDKKSSIGYLNEDS